MLIAKGEEAGESDAIGTHGAGLVMRHGERNVSSEAVRSWLIQNEKRQEALVEKANKRGGRGKTRRKKTISDMSGLLASMNSGESSDAPLSNTISMEETASPNDVSPYATSRLGESESGLDLDGTLMRDPTVPGVFRKTRDPFGKGGLYNVGM
jgi:hypothetical protein